MNKDVAQDIRICFVGDSIVNGTDDETALGWVGRISAEAHSFGVPVTSYNLGIRRDTSRDILKRWKNECVPRLPSFCDGRIVLSCGINDTSIENGEVRIKPDESCSNVRAILVEAKKYNVIMVGPPPIADDEQNIRIREISKAFTNEAQLLDVPYIELFEGLSLDEGYKKELLEGDGAHPRSQGYSKITTLISSSSSWWFRPS